MTEERFSRIKKVHDDLNAKKQELEKLDLLIEDSCLIATVIGWPGTSINQIEVAVDSQEAIRQALIEQRWKTKTEIVSLEKEFEKL